MSIKLRFISNVIRRLRQRYGQPVGIYQYASSTTNRSTGVITRTITQQDISKALVLPATLETKRLLETGYTQGSRGFSDGGEFDANERVFLINKNDLGSFVPDSESWIVYQSVKYMISKIIDFADASAFTFEAVATVGEVFVELRNKRSTHYLTLGQVIEVEHVQS